MKAKHRLLRDLMLLLLFAMPIGVTGALAQDKASDDPRMAGFKGKIARY